MADCPHCKQDLGSGFLDQATHVARLNAKEQRSKELEAELKTTRAKADAHDQLAAELAKEKARADAAEQRGIRSVALARAGITDDKAAKRVEAIYALHQAEEGEAALAFDAWLQGPAREDVILSPVFAAPAQASAAAGKGAQAPAQAPKGLPPANAGAKADAGQAPGKLTPKQASDAYAEFAANLRRTEPDPKKREAAMVAKKAELEGRITQAA